MIMNFDFTEDRNRYLDCILNANAKKKLIIAGPGTGKTYTFKKILEKTFESEKKKGLVITFIKNLVKDLKKELSNYADVRTFHSFCRSEILRINKHKFEYYPNLLRIIESDLRILKPSIQLKNNIEHLFYVLNETEIKKILGIADYYNAAGHTDSVYRVYKHYQQHEDDIPCYPIVLVDEYQDFNLLETKLVEMLAQKSPILIIGDDDQALYTFKKSSPKFIRDLAKDSYYKRYELPYCSRCTKVIVDAINEIITISKRNNRLVDRIDKEFKYYPPEKEKDSKENPYIMDVKCSVERKNCPYAAKYIFNEIIRMPDEYKKEALNKNEPTALIIGPKQFLRSIKSYMKEMNSELLYNGMTYIEEKEEMNKPNIIDGYKLLLNKPDSNLGWRIILEEKKDTVTVNMIKQAIKENKSITSLINRNIYNEQKKIIEILNKLIKQRPTKEEIKLIEERIKMPIDEIRKSFSDERDYEEREAEENGKSRILCTSFEGSKGLAAQYVFIVGFNKDYFPRKTPPEDIDICRLIVALTRARKRVYLISYKIDLSGKSLNDSIFKSYLNKYLSEPIMVDKDYIKRLS